MKNPYNAKFIKKIGVFKSLNKKVSCEKDYLISENGELYEKAYYNKDYKPFQKVLIAKLRHDFNKNYSTYDIYEILLPLSDYFKNTNKKIAKSWFGYNTFIIEKK